MSEKICASLNHVASKSKFAMVVQEYERYCSTSLSYILPNQTKLDQALLVMSDPLHWKG